jgi:hypothetical protein
MARWYHNTGTNNKQGLLIRVTSHFDDSCSVHPRRGVPGIAEEASFDMCLHEREAAPPVARRNAVSDLLSAMEYVVSLSTCHYSTSS